MVSKIILKVFYGILFLFVGGLSFYGRTYYFLPLVKKVRHPLHPVLRQSGSLGHFLGVLGTLFMILLLAYSIRKHIRFMKNFGHINVWLDFHIFLGFAGPILVLFHTCFKINGIVSLSFWAMVFVVFSGIVGRHIYRMIPRSISGMELNRIELEAEEIGLTFEMRKIIPAEHRFWQVMSDIEQQGGKFTMGKLLFTFVDTAVIRSRLKKTMKDIEGLSPKDRRRLLKTVVKRQRFVRRIRLLDRTSKILHYWHLVHRPFVIIMFMILIIHIVITLRMGHRWIF